MVVGTASTVKYWKGPLPQVPSRLTEQLLCACSTFSSSRAMGLTRAFSGLLLSNLIYVTIICIYSEQYGI